jgi:hypothetical protein
LLLSRTENAARKYSGTEHRKEAPYLQHKAGYCQHAQVQRIYNYYHGDKHLQVQQIIICRESQVSKDAEFESVEKSAKTITQKS